LEGLELKTRVPVKRCFCSPLKHESEGKYGTSVDHVIAQNRDLSRIELPLEDRL